MKEIHIKKPTVIDPCFQVYGNGTFSIMKTLRGLGFSFNKDNRSYEIKSKAADVQANIQEIEKMILKIHKAAKNCNASLSQNKQIKVHIDEEQTTVQESQRSRKPPSSRFIDESIMNANNQYTKGRIIDGKRINTNHGFIKGDEREIPTKYEQISVSEVNNNIEFYGATHDNKEFLKERFKARFDETKEVWWCNKIQFPLKMVKKQLKDMDLLREDNSGSDSDNEMSEEDSEYIPTPELESFNINANISSSKSSSLSSNGTSVSTSVSTGSDINVRLEDDRIIFGVNGPDDIAFIKDNFCAKFDKRKDVWYANKNRLLLKLVNEVIEERIQSDRSRSGGRSRSRSRSRSRGRGSNNKYYSK